MNYLVESMKGLGDNVFQTHIIRALTAAGHKVWLTTPWPELYRGIPGLSFVKPSTSLRTQAKNISRQNEEIWTDPPKSCLLLKPRYTPRDMAHRSIIASMERKSGFRSNRISMVLPDFGTMPKVVAMAAGSRPVAMIRPVTVRSEWTNTARNPLPKYVFDAARVLHEAGFFVVSVADLEAGKEWLEGDAPYADIHLHGGELKVTDLMALMQNSALVVGGVGFIVPTCIAMRVPLICILGGNGGHNAPAKITDPRMDLSKIRFITPDRFCSDCVNTKHDCDKTIKSFTYAFNKHLERLCSKTTSATTME